ncbi:MULTISPECIES: histidine phosphatase family protein [unclassified Enterococcus]|uniref:histidine phosphatase family protein n=1 Tax=unclassified Enterococcus TaxID=2608891 RepID=UPI001555DE13|nr:MULTISPECIES: histidine phosphatase family protein [unclassified Enterococcus]MBS7578014.1 histidine phosphatase family protein [Enterococcus sp. MMGLQ5-2]MBS7585296.1 histidine phosphatase family protein [Enterococcus sp. MMGLQ5-1]NPD13153.1 histidine phosphatase family protein [Enterococcus sp. MMGLQ5-1]NPD37845.1 histidine phosphatase family protein [Enterococcus sp. MMGLQ5-2]
MLYVARHGQTQWNIQGRICGHADVELTAAGIEQAKRLAELVNDLPERVTHILTSPLNRAINTAAIIAEKNEASVRIEPRLIEMDFGIFDGRLINDSAFQKARREFSMPFTDGESILDVAGRIYPLLDSLSSKPNQTYLLVCHNALIRVIDNYFNGKVMNAFLNYNVDNTVLLQYDFSS